MERPPIYDTMKIRPQMLTYKSKEEIMSISQHLDALNTKHEELERQIHDAYTHHLPVAELKKQKLRVKEEIAFLLRRHPSNENQKPSAAA